MNSQNLDPVKYKMEQRRQWGVVAEGWKKWWKTFEAAGQHVSDNLIDMAEIKTGYRVLDIATGIGEPAITAARYVGERGHVVATDQAHQMLLIAKERADKLSIKNIDFKEMDAENLNFMDNSFDAVICRWGLMFLPDLSTALKKTNKILVPGRIFAASVWESSPMISIAMETAQKMFKLPPPPKGTPSIFGLANGIIEDRLKEAGFYDIKSNRVTVTFKFSSIEDFNQYEKDIAAPIIALLENQPEERQIEFWQELSKSSEQFVLNDGRLHIPGVTICASGRR